MAAVVLGSILVICLTSVLLFRLIRRKCGNPLMAIGVMLTLSDKAKTVGLVYGGF